MLKKEDPDSNQQVKSLLELKSYWQLNIGKKLGLMDFIITNII
jgi:hypothetical protein